jgi:uncharacterized protein with NAD-binding domain and iron-sulfur cluster
MSRLASRREFLAAAGTAAAAGAALGPGAAFAAKRRPSTGRDVAVFGAGVAGLTAAHELAERGFRVTLYERDHLGGKAWSVGVPGSASGGRSPLPGEHGFRFFPGFYRCLGDTMRRIPSARGGTSYDRLIEASAYRTSFAGRPDLTTPLGPPRRPPTPDTFAQSLAAAIVEAQMLPPHEALYFASKLGVYVTSCDERRLQQWERVSWKDFIREEQMSAEYRKVMSRSLVRNLAATKSDDASTHSIGLVGEASVMSLMGRGNDENATFDRVLDGPTSEVWLDDWAALLRRHGVRFRVGWKLKSLHMRNGRLSAARVRDPRGAMRTIHPDWFVCAMPLERTAALLTPAMLAADPQLEGIRRLRTDWMVGMQFYLRRPVPLADGHVNYVDSPFALTSISQAQFWRRELGTYGDGSVRESLSVILSDWETPGILYGKTAQQCTPDELASETWAQLKAHLNDSGEPVLRDEALHSWFLDPAMQPARTGGLTNTTPLFIQNPGSWYDRPDSRTEVPNLNVTTMDGANQGGRQAANALLEAAGSRKRPADVWGLHRPPEYDAFKQIDRERFRRGLAHAFDPDQQAPGA